MTIATYRNQYWVTHPLTKGLDQIQPKSSLKMTSHPSALAFSNVAYMNITLPFEDNPSKSEPSNLCSFVVSLILGTVVPRVDEKKETDITNTSVMTTVISEVKQDMSSQARQQGDSSSRKNNDFRKPMWTCTDHVKDIECDYEDNEYHYESCEYDSEGWCSSSDDEEEEEEEEEWQGEESEKEDTECEDDDEVVQFSSMTQASSCPSSNPNQEVIGTCLIQHLCAPVLSHTSSFSSDESGFHERNQSDWSDESEDEDSYCPFDEGLWHQFEEQGCFNDLFLPCDTLKKNLCNKTSTANACGTNDTRTHVDINEGEATGSPVDSDLLSRPHTSQKKSVTFKADHELEEVHYIIAWQYAYRSARKGPWEQFARDRDRFKNRIESVKCVLEPCLIKKLENTTAQ